jgi:toxin YoeB
MKIVFTENAWEDLAYWVENDIDQVKKVKELINSIQKTPFKGIGKPEPLKHQLKGYWSRRINHEHRLVYEISGKKNVDQICKILQCRFHYK